MNPLHLLRMAKWAKHPPSERRVKMVLWILVICAVLFAIERLVGWPDMLTIKGGAGGRYFR